MATKSATKKKLFRLQKANFVAIKASFPYLELPSDILDMVVCPICLRIISINLEEPNFATVEHAPPSKLGGKIVCLTCKNCNSTQGSALDSKLIGYYKVAQSFKGNGTNFTDAKVRVNNSLPINAKFYVTADNSWRIIPLEENSNPVIVATINQIFEQAALHPNTNFSLNLQIPQPHPRIIRIALIRAAYLIAFGQFGYGFIVNPALNYIRNLLLEPDDENLYPHGGHVQLSHR